MQTWEWCRFSQSRIHQNKNQEKVKYFCDTSSNPLFFFPSHKCSHKHTRKHKHSYKAYWLAWPTAGNDTWFTKTGTYKEHPHRNKQEAQRTYENDLVCRLSCQWFMTSCHFEGKNLILVYYLRSGTEQQQPVNHYSH